MIVFLGVASASLPASSDFSFPPISDQSLSVLLVYHLWFAKLMAFFYFKFVAANQKMTHVPKLPHPMDPPSRVSFVSKNQLCFSWKTSTSPATWFGVVSSVSNKRSPSLANAQNEVIFMSPANGQMPNLYCCTSKTETKWQ